MVANTNVWQIKAEFNSKTDNLSWEQRVDLPFGFFKRAPSISLDDACEDSDYFYYFYGVTLWRLENPSSIIQILAEGKIFS